jgi:hypothetical protein
MGRHEAPPPIDQKAQPATDSQPRKTAEALTAKGRRFMPAGFGVGCKILRRGNLIRPTGSFGKAFLTSPIEELSKPLTDVGGSAEVSRFQNVREIIELNLGVLVLHDLTPLFSHGQYWSIPVAVYLREPWKMVSSGWSFVSSSGAA